MITELMFKSRAIEIARQLNINDFKCSRTFLRNGMSYRTSTHRAQQNTKTVASKFQDTIYFLNKLNSNFSEYDPEFILNMDETP